MADQWEVLVVKSDFESRRVLVKALETQGLDPICTCTVSEGLAVLKTERVALLFCDPHMVDGSYRDLLTAIRSAALKTRMVVTARHSERDELLDAARDGAFSVISVPCRPTDVEWMVIQTRRDERLSPLDSRTDAPVYRRAAASRA